MSKPPPDEPRRQDGKEQSRPAASPENEQNDTEQGRKNNAQFHGFGPRMFRAAEIALALAGVAAIVLGLKMWQESAIDRAVEKKLVDPFVLRKVAEQSRPSLIFDGNGAILHDMGAAQYLKPDDIKIVEHVNDQGFIMPTKLHIGFVRPVSFAPLVTPLRDVASLTASNGKGLDWEFAINWTVVPTDTNDSSHVFRLELVP